MASTVPKEPARRQRRNRSAGAAVLTIVKPDSRSSTPGLPDGLTDDFKWHPLTVRWWSNLWRSPMAPEYDTSDIDQLYVLALLVDGFWKKPSKELAAEIRLQRQCFGLTPIDRRRLQWEIDRGEEAAAKTAQRKASSKPRPATRKDPRSALA